MTANSPFHEVNHFKNLFLSLFSYMDNFILASNKNSILKIPFTINWEQEKSILSKVDIRISGFGLLFSGILIISIIIILLQLLKIKKDKKSYFFLINLFTCFGLTFTIKESWWARYSPYIYFIILISLYIILESITSIKTIIGIVFAILIINNNLLFLYPIPEELKYSNQIDSNIKNLKNHEPLYVYTNFSGIYFNLKDNGIYYKIDKNLANDNSAKDLNYRDVKWKSFK